MGGVKNPKHFLGTLYEWSQTCIWHQEGDLKASSHRCSVIMPEGIRIQLCLRPTRSHLQKKADMSIIRIKGLLIHRTCHGRPRTLLVKNLQSKTCCQRRLFHRAPRRHCSNPWLVHQNLPEKDNVIYDLHRLFANNVFSTHTTCVILCAPST